MYFSLISTIFLFNLLFEVEEATMIKTISSRSALTRVEWATAAHEHRRSMEKLLYPSSVGTLKERRHQVSEHPIYNFLHTYYRYSAESLMKYSPGANVRLEGVEREDLKPSGLLHPKFALLKDGALQYCAFDNMTDFTGAKKLHILKRNHEILRSSSQRQPLFSCYGLHEWAMLYKDHEKHQKQLALRVSQQTIDEVVEEIPLRCTHYDAFRFFAPDAKPHNAIQLDSRESQLAREQPACIHATMDLFKYAYTLYPLCSSDLLRECLALAFRARYTDMRASPYAVHQFEGCEKEIAVETPQGRAEYAREQEDLLEASRPVRSRVLEAYDLLFLQLAMG